MVVCAHGDVAAFCKERDLIICETWEGDLIGYSGGCRVIVTDQEMSAQEFYYLRMVMFSKGYDVRSVHYPDIDEKLNEFMEYIGMQERSRRKNIYGGRQPFGFTRRNGVVVEIPEMMAVARRILELRDAGMTLREIQTDEGVHHPDGRKISVSTIQLIVKNREKYENG